MEHKDVFHTPDEQLSKQDFIEALKEARKKLEESARKSLLLKETDAEDVVNHNREVNQLLERMEAWLKEHEIENE